MNYLDQNNELEAYLKGQSDKLRMIPSKNIWNSIYNDIHPSKKWPSIRILVLILLAISTLSYYNANIKNEKNSFIAASENNDNNNDIESKNENAFPVEDDIFSNKTINIPLSETNNSISLVKKHNIKSDSEISINNLNGNFVENKINLKNSNSNKENEYLTKVANNKEITVFENITNEAELNQNLNKLSNSLIEIKKSEIILDNELKNKINIVNNFEQNKSIAIISNSEKEQTINKKSKSKKWAAAIDFTPLYTFRNLTENASHCNALYNINTLGLNPNQKKNDKLVLGFQTSINGVKKLNRKTDLVLGLGYSHKKFNIAVSHSDAPIFARILQTVDINNSNSGVVTRSVVTNLNNSAYNNTSFVTENNKELFLNIEVKKVLAAFKTNKLILGLGLQPFLNLSRSSYLLSNDTENYAKVDGSKKYFNANLNLTLGYQFPISQRSTLDLNALFQSQFSPSYDKKFTMQEQLRSAGLRLRVITQL